VRAFGYRGRTFERKILDYELAKQLKDVGFPQVGIGTMVDSTGGGHRSLTNAPFPLDCMYAPNLEEFIEACGENPSPQPSSREERGEGEKADRCYTQPNRIVLYGSGGLRRLASPPISLQKKHPSKHERSNAKSACRNLQEKSRLADVNASAWQEPK
jgi:hypothetical protein